MSVSAVTPLACAVSAGHGAFAEDVVAMHSSLVVAELRARFAGPLEAVSASLRAFLDALDDELDFETVWDPALGGLHYVLSEDPQGLAPRAIAFALRLHERGVAGEWDSPLDDGARFHFDRWPLPAGHTMRVRSDGARVSIRVTGSDHDATLCFVRRGPAWEVDAGLRGMPQAEDGGRRVLVWGHRELWSNEVRDLAVPVDDSAPELMAERCARAMAFLRERAPVHHAWVMRLLRFVAPWRVFTEQRPSGSSSANLAPGLVGVGNHDHIVSFADSLVHEASHHYFYVALRLGPVHDGSDPTLYHNPFLELQRPIDRILLAYHAFVNVLTFCREAAPRGDEAYFTTRIDRLEHGLAGLERGLLATRALTPSGMALFEQLRSTAHA